MTKSFAPSSLADSSRLSGIPRKAVLQMIILYVEIAPGMVTAQNVLFIFRIFEMSR